MIHAFLHDRDRGFENQGEGPMETYRLSPETEITIHAIARHSADPERFVRQLPTVLELEAAMPAADARADEWERWIKLKRSMAADVLDTVSEITEILAEMDTSEECR